MRRRWSRRSSRLPAEPKDVELKAGAEARLTLDPAGRRRLPANHTWSLSGRVDGGSRSWAPTSTRGGGGRPTARGFNRSAPGRRGRRAWGGVSDDQIGCRLRHGRAVPALGRGNGPVLAKEVPVNASTRCEGDDMVARPVRRGDVRAVRGAAGGRGPGARVRVGRGHASHVGSLGPGHDADDARVLGCGDRGDRAGYSVADESGQSATARQGPRYSPAALRAGRDQQGRVRGEEARPRVTGSSPHSLAAMTGRRR